MTVKKSNYEALLAEHSNVRGAIGLLNEYRPYLETLILTELLSQVF